MQSASIRVPLQSQHAIFCACYPPYSFCCHLSMLARPAASSTWRMRPSRSSRSTVHFMHAMFARRTPHRQLPCQRAYPPRSCCTWRLKLSWSLATAASSERRAQMRSFCLATVSDTPASHQSQVTSQSPVYAAFNRNWAGPGCAPSAWPQSLTCLRAINHQSLYLSMLPSIQNVQAQGALLLLGYSL